MHASRPRELMILAVDRDPMQIDALRDWLEANGHDLLCANSVVQALRWLRTIRPDVLLLDVGGLHGSEVLRWLKSQPSSYWEMPIVFLAATDQQWELPNREIWPLSLVMVKPVTREKLAARLDELFGWKALGLQECEDRTPPPAERKYLPEGLAS